LSTTVLLSAFVIAQVLIALAVITDAPAQGVGRARALDLFFASHAPWSLWILGAGFWMSLSIWSPAQPPVLAALVPLVLTPRMVPAYFREVLGFERRRAMRRTLVHQAVTWSLFIALYGTAVAIRPRVLQAFS